MSALADDAGVLLPLIRKDTASVQKLKASVERLSTLAKFFDSKNDVVQFLKVYSFYCYCNMLYIYIFLSYINFAQLIASLP